MSRSVFEVTVELLDAIHCCPKLCKSRLFAYVGINPQKGNKIVSRLQACGFVGQPNPNVRYAGVLCLTDRGLSWLRGMMLLLDELGDDEK